MRAIILFFLLFITSLKTLYAQPRCECDTINKKNRFSGYCKEYLDYRLKIVSKDKAQFVHYIFYNNGVKLYFYPAIYRLWKNQKNYLNSRLIVKADSIIVLNGVLETFARDSNMIEQFYFKDGLIIKDVDKYWSIFHSKKLNGTKPSSISEYDYSSGFVRQHYIHYRKNGEVKKNCDARRTMDGNWYDFNTLTLMNDDINSFNTPFFFKK